MIGVIRACKESTMYTTYTPPQCEKKSSNFEKGSKHEANGEVGGCKGAQLRCVKTPVGKATGGKWKGRCKRLLLLACVVTVFGLPHEQKSILVDAAWLKRSKKSHDTECTPVETEPVCTDHVHASAGNVVATGFECIQREKRKKERTIQKENKSR